MQTKQLKRFFAVSAISLSLVISITAVKALGEREFSTYPVSPQAEAQLVSSTVEGSEGSHCLPESATNAILLASAVGDSQIYQVWQMRINGVPVTQVTTLFGQACGKINDSRTFIDPQSQSLFDGMDEDTALELAIQYYEKKVAQVGGPEAYWSGLSVFLEEERLETGVRQIFTTVEVEALQAVGVQLSGDGYEIREHRGYEPL